MRAIALLSFWKFKNSLRTIFTDPRKLIPVLFVVAMFGFFTLMSSLASAPPPSKVAGMKLSPDYFEGAVRLGMLFVVYGVLSYSLGDGLLALGRPDVDYVFPSPVSRRAVLVLKLPALLFGTMFQAIFLLFSFRMATQTFVQASGAYMGNVHSPGWYAPAAVVLCVASYLNLGLFLSVHFPNRRSFKGWVIGFFILLAAFLAWTVWRQGISAGVGVLDSGAIRVLFWPAMLASDVLFATNFRQPVGMELGWLAVVFVVSLVPMFLSNSNWYERSVVSTERMANLRQAAKGGSAAVMAARAEKHKYKGTRTYTVQPFGQGAGALFWAHLCSAGKRALANFGLPFAGGILIGGVGAAVSYYERIAGPLLVLGMLLYGSFGFMASARTACEAAVRRRELIAPLPIPTWQAVAADLGVPFVLMYLTCVGAATAYVVGGGSYGAYVLYGALILFPLRTASRMTLQYIMVLGYPDFADKVQQFVAQFAYWIIATPFLLAEVLLCLPAIFLQSIWVGAFTLTVLEAGLVMAFLALAGKASGRAVATGEPVRFWSLLRRA